LSALPLFLFPKSLPKIDVSVVDEDIPLSKQSSNIQTSKIEHLKRNTKDNFIRFCKGRLLVLNFVFVVPRLYCSFCWQNAL